jgi:AraC family transcriptional regulator
MMRRRGRDRQRKVPPKTASRIKRARPGRAIISPMDPQDVYLERIGRAVTLLEARLDEDVRLDEVARAAHFSPFHFHRLFRGMTGETVGEFVRRLRLERAAYRMQQGEGDLLRIALDAGYQSHEAFTRAFKRRFGMAPSLYRSRQRRVLEDILARKGAFEVDVKIVEREPMRVASVRHVGPYEEVGEAWQALMKWGWSKMIFGKPECFGLCYDDPEVTPADKIRYDACLEVGPKARGKGEVRIQEIPGGTFAVAVHEGPYAGFAETYAGLFAEVAGGPIDGRPWTLGDAPSIEKYLNDPRKTKPEDLRTEVMVRVE